MTRAPYYLLDVFTDHLFGGNPLAIFPDARGIPEAMLQRIARELNLSETVFLLPADPAEPMTMRIFTPATEMPTAGHPTIGTALFLAREYAHPEEGRITLTLRQPVGDIPVEVAFENNVPTRATMYQPLPTYGPIHTDRAPFAELLGLPTSSLADLPIQEVSCGNQVLFIPVKDQEALKTIRFQNHQWIKLRSQVHAVMTYAFTMNALPSADVQGRMFAPDLGIAEDPATGSANGPLACYLFLHKLVPLPVVSLQGFEMDRPSYMYLDIEQNTGGQLTAVKVAGECVIVGKGEFFLDFH